MSTSPQFIVLRQALPWLVVMALIGTLLVALAPILTPFIFAFILAYILAPGARWLNQRGLPRSIAALIMMVMLSIGAVILFLLLLVILQRELPILREQLPTLLKHLNDFLQPKLADLGITMRFDFPEWQKMLRERIAESPDEIIKGLSQTLLFSGSAIMTLLSMVVFVPLVLFYLLKDRHILLERLTRMIPPRWRRQILHLGAEVDALLSQYLRGQLLVMLILAIYYSVALWLAGFDAALPIGVLTGLAVFIPYIGFGAGLTLALLAALLQFGDWHGLMWVAVIYGIGQIAESFFLTPILVGERIGLHPLVVIFSLLAFAQLFGFFGVLVALPASAVILVLLRHLNRAYHASHFYR